MAEQGDITNQAKQSQMPPFPPNVTLFKKQKATGLQLLPSTLMPPAYKQLTIFRCVSRFLLSASFLPLSSAARHQQWVAGRTPRSAAA
jgi:hypothetical protein